MKGIFNLKDLKAFLGNDKAVKIILAAGTAIILFFFLAEISKVLGGNSEQSDNTSSINELESKLEKRLCAILGKIEGVGEISVMVTLESSEETLVGDRSTVTGVAAPSVRGVIIVCDGGGSIVVKQKLVEAVSGALGVSSARVSVVT